MAWALHVDDLEDLNRNLAKLIDLKLPQNAGAAIGRGLDQPHLRPIPAAFPEQL